MSKRSWDIVFRAERHQRDLMFPVPVWFSIVLDILIITLGAVPQSLFSVQAIQVDTRDTGRFAL